MNLHPPRRFGRFCSPVRGMNLPNLRGGCSRVCSPACLGRVRQRTYRAAHSPSDCVVLHDFVTSNRDELVRRCRSMSSERGAPAFTPAGPDHGVPLVLEQLASALRCEVTPPRSTPATIEVSRTAVLHGKALREQGYTAGQVVQDYADISQAITELAAERRAPVTVEELHSLDRFLDSAIADAVASYGNLTRSRELFAKR